MNGVPQGGVSSLLLYILYADDVLDVISDAIVSALFVDDLAGLWCSHDHTNLINKINNDFNKIHCWSTQNQQIFASSKFQMLNIGLRLDNDNKGDILFGNMNLTWEKEANYLGFLIDSKLKFTQEMLSRSQALLTNSWRIFQFSSPVDGLDSGTLNLILNSYS